VKGRPEWAAFSFFATSVCDRRRRRRPHASVLHRESVARGWIDQLFAEITRVADDYSRVHPSRSDVSMLRANLISRDDARHVRIESSFHTTWPGGIFLLPS